MKTFTLDRAAEIVVELFNKYIEPYAFGIMSGELPAISLKVYRTTTKDGDWSATVRLKNTLTISVFRCEVYIPDILTLCRTTKMYLQTEEVFRIVSLFYMLHGLCQQEHMHFNTDTDRDYESMMVGAGYSAYKFIKQFYEFSNDSERVALDLVYYQTMIFTNNYKHAPRNIRVGDLMEDLQIQYRAYMTMYHRESYRSSIRLKAWINQVDEDGFLVLEKKSGTRTESNKDSNVRPEIYNEHKRSKTGKILW